MRDRLHNAKERNGQPGMWITARCRYFWQTVPFIERDPEFMDALRARAWHRAERKRITLAPDGQTVLCPDEWPEGIDPRSYALRYLDTQERRAELGAALRDLDE